MPSKGWFNLEAAGGVIPDTQFFEGESAFSFLGLTRTQRLYGFVGWWVFLPRRVVSFSSLPTAAGGRGAAIFLNHLQYCFPVLSLLTLSSIDATDG